MRPILSREQIRAYDAFAVEHCRVPGVVLMENAGRGAADIIAEMAEPDGGAIVVACGRGNNGGDGLVVARHLRARGFEVRVFLLDQPQTVKGDARLNLDAFLGLGGEIEVLEDGFAALADALDRAQLAIDALLGTGLDRPVEGPHAGAIDALNDAPCPCVSLDLPSGLDADTGAVHGKVVHADVTITFAAHKAGLVQGASAEHAGDIEVVGLGIFDGAVLAHTGWLGCFIEPRAVRLALGERAPDTNKYQSGNVLVVAGSAGKSGAALLAARAALRAGAGIATIASWPDAIATLEPRVEEVMTCTIDPEAIRESLSAALVKRASVAIGPGLGLDVHARALTEEVVLGFKGPVVVDADAISAFAGRPEVIAGAPAARVITPHAGELARLLGTSSSDVERDRFGAVREAAARTGATVVLKGRHTLVASGSVVAVCDVGNEVLATAGSGDVLTGVCAALLCGAPAHDAASAAVYLHALAADRWREAVGADRGMIAGDLVEGLPGAIAAVEHG